MQSALAGNGLLVFMALQAEGTCCGSLQFNAGDIPGDANLVTGKAADFDSRMNRLPVRLLFVALQASGSGRIFFNRDGMLGSLKRHNAAHHPEGYLR